MSPRLARRVISLCHDGFAGLHPSVTDRLHPPTSPGTTSGSSSGPGSFLLPPIVVGFLWWRYTRGAVAGCKPSGRFRMRSLDSAASERADAERDHEVLLEELRAHQARLAAERAEVDQRAAAYIEEQRRAIARGPGPVERRAARRPSPDEVLIDGEGNRLVFDPMFGCHLQASGGGRARAELARRVQARRRVSICRAPRRRGAGRPAARRSPRSSRAGPDSDPAGGDPPRGGPRLDGSGRCGA